MRKTNVIVTELMVIVLSLGCYDDDVDDDDDGISFVLFVLQ